MEQVQGVLGEYDLLVLPSANEPFPMVVLEALAVGTPVLIMPSCGLADSLRSFQESYVATSESMDGVKESFQMQLNENFKSKSRTQISEFISKTFGINSVASSLLQVYRKAIENVN